MKAVINHGEAYCGKCSKHFLSVDWANRTTNSRCAECETPIDADAEIRKAECLAWDAASRSKFWMFGYHAARVHYLRHLSGKTGAGPFIEVKRLAERKVREGRTPKAARLE